MIIYYAFTSTTQAVILQWYIFLMKNCSLVLCYDGLNTCLGFGTGEMHIKFWWGNLYDYSHSEDREDIKITLRWILWRHFARTELA
jgi:hypothetical protein